jgi:LysM repeat protein
VFPVNLPCAAWRGSVGRDRRHGDRRADTRGCRSDFDPEFNQVSNSTPAPSAGAYQVQSGDTLESIAQSAYGDSSLWYLIAQANGLSGDKDLRVGQTLVIPATLPGVHNNASTNAVYNGSLIIGGTTPTLPSPQGGCGVLGQVIAEVIQVVVQVVVYAVTVEYLGPVAAGAPSGAAGSVAGQLVGIALGSQSSFSWDAVAEAAVQGALSGGVSRSPTFHGAHDAGPFSPHAVLKER